MLAQGYRARTARSAAAPKARPVRVARPAAPSCDLLSVMFGACEFRVLAPVSTARAGRGTRVDDEGTYDYSSSADSSASSYDAGAAASAAAQQTSDTNAMNASMAATQTQNDMANMQTSNGINNLGP